MGNYSSQQTSSGKSLVQRQAPHLRGVEKARNPKQALIRLFEYLLPYRKTLLITVVIVLLYTLLGLAGPYWMGQAIDKFISGKDVQGLVKTASFMLVAYVFSNLFSLFANWIMAGVSQKALKNLRADLFTHLQRLSMKFFDENPAGNLMSRLTNDIDTINQAVSQNIISLIASVLSMAGIMITMFVLNAWLALASLLVVPIMIWFTRFVAKYSAKGFRRLQKDLGELNSITEETFSGQKVIKAFRRKDVVTRIFNHKNLELFHSAIYANTYALLLMPLTNVLGNFFVVVLASLGGWLALKGLVSIGIIATFITYGQNFINPLRQVANLYNNVQAALAGAERVFDIFDTPVETPDSDEPLEFGSVKGDVNFSNVNFGYNPDKPVIRNFSLNVHAGQTIALVGPTGAGKTTIINLLTRFYEIQNGTIKIDGIDIRQIRKKDLRRKLGLVMQDTYLFAETVLENIRFGRLEASDEECMEAAKLTEADQFIRQLPQGYNTILSERAGNISQGQRQLLSITRAVLADPAILILDEATSSIDTRTEVRIQNALLRLMQGRTSFVIAHRLSTIRDADKVVVIKNGEIVETGTHEELLEMKGFYHHLFISQFKGNAI